MKIIFKTLLRFEALVYEISKGSNWNQSLGYLFWLKEEE
jgi:hypothetical protein